jgi:hypothetical protein
MGRNSEPPAHVNTWGHDVAVQRFLSLPLSLALSGRAIRYLKNILKEEIETQTANSSVGTHQRILFQHTYTLFTSLISTATNNGCVKSKSSQNCWHQFLDLFCLFCKLVGSSGDRREFSIKIVHHLQVIYLAYF